MAIESKPCIAGCKEKSDARMERLMKRCGWLWAVAALDALALGCHHGSGTALAVDAGAAGGGGTASPPEVTTELPEGGSGADAPPVGAAPAEAWSRTFDRGEGYADRARAVAVGADGTIVVAGETEQTRPPLDLDVWIRKYDAAGTELWTRTYDSAPGDGLGDDQAFAVAVDGAGAVVVTGVEHRNRLWLRKYDAAGTEAWTVSGEAGTGRGLAIDKSGNVVLTGESIGLRKYDGAGKEILRKPLAGLDGASLALALDESMAVVGSTPGIIADIVVRKLGGTGEELWTRSFDGGLDDRGYAVAIDVGGNIVAGGVSGRGRRDTLWLRKYDGAGNVLWTRDGDAGSAAAVVTDASGVVVANNQGFTFVLRRYDGAGNTSWSTKNGTDVVGSRYPTALALDGRGALVAAGWVMVRNMVFAPPEDVFVVKYGP
jgi:hypothetical protein